MGCEFGHAREAVQKVAATAPGAASALSPLEVSLDPRITIGLDSKVTDLNEAMSGLIGLPRERVVQTEFSGWFTEPEQARALCALVIANGFVAGYPLTIRGDSGSFANLLFNASVYGVAVGQPAGVFLAARDVTEGPVAEPRYRTFFEAAPNAMVLIDSDGTILLLNNQTERLFGYRREELIGKAVEILLPGRFRDGHPWHRSKFFAEPRVRAMGPGLDPWGLRADGTEFPIEVSLSPIESPVGLTVGAIIRDVTGSRRVTRELAETKNLLDNVLASCTKYSIIGKDLNHRVVSWNEGARRNYQYTAEEILGRDVEILHTPEDMESGAVERLLTTAFENLLAEGEFERVRKDGTRFWANVVVTRRDDANGNPIGYLLMSHDISARRQAEDQAQANYLYARSLLEASLDPLVTISPEGKITDVNEATVKVTGVPRENLVGTDFSDYFTEPEKARRGYQRVFAEGSVIDYPLTIRGRNQVLTEVAYNATVYRDRHGQVLGVFAGARDVTSQRRADAQIAEQRRKELDRLGDLERFHKLTIGRELKMIELKKEIKELKERSVMCDVEFAPTTAIR